MTGPWVRGRGARRRQSGVERAGGQPIHVSTGGSWKRLSRVGTRRGGQCNAPILKGGACSWNTEARGLRVSTKARGLRVITETRGFSGRHQSTEAQGNHRSTEAPGSKTRESTASESLPVARHGKRELAGSTVFAGSTVLGNTGNTRAGALGDPYLWRRSRRNLVLGSWSQKSRLGTIETRHGLFPEDLHTPIDWIPSPYSSTTPPWRPLALCSH